MGIEPTSQAWEAGILPMNYTRIDFVSIAYPFQKSKQNFSPFFSRKRGSPAGEPRCVFYQVSHIRRKASIISSSVS